jgi:hypothetical protein
MTDICQLYNYMRKLNEDSSVNIMTGYGLDDRSSIPKRAIDVRSRHYILTGPTLLLSCTDGVIPDVKNMKAYSVQCIL